MNIRKWRLSLVGSMDRRNTLREHFSRRMKMQCFARSLIELARD
jgi:hypothetical protein